jgi:hypothetical protein
MIYPGTHDVDTPRPKDGQESSLKRTPGSKCLDHENLSMTATASKVGPAPPSRIYTRDYSKKGRDPDQTDLITSVLGNPFRL